MLSVHIFWSSLKRRVEQDFHKKKNSLAEGEDIVAYNNLHTFKLETVSLLPVPPSTASFIPLCVILATHTETL